MMHIPESAHDPEFGLQQTIDSLNDVLVAAQPLLEFVRDKGVLIEMAIPAAGDTPPLTAAIRSVGPSGRGQAAEGVWAVEQPARPSFYVAFLASGKRDDMRFGNVVDMNNGSVENHGVGIVQIEEVTRILQSATEQYEAGKPAEPSTRPRYRGVDRIVRALRKK